MSPKLVPAGVFTGLVVPLNVIVVVPLMFVKFTTLVPLILNTPVVEKVTGSAFACDIPSSPIPTSSAPITVAFKKPFILAPPHVFCIYSSACISTAHQPARTPARNQSSCSAVRRKLPAFLHTSGQNRCEDALRYFFLRRRKPVATPTKPVPSNNILAGSGTVVGGVASVPNWITTLLNVELTVTPGATSVSVNVPARNGLCGSFPAILPLAFAYAPLPVPPISV